MKNSKTIDIFDIGKNTFNLCYSQLNNDKKILKIYSQNIDTLLNVIEDNKNALTNIFRDIGKYSSVDKPFGFLKKFEILLNIQCNYYNCFLENSQKSFENLKKSIDTNLKLITDFLSNTHNTGEIIKNKSVNFFEKNDQVIKSLKDVEYAVIDDYIRSTYKITINRDNIYNIEQIVNKIYNLEKEYNTSKKEIKELLHKFTDEYNCNIKEIKTKMTKLNEDNKKDIKDIILIMKNTFLTLLNNTTKDIDNYDKKNDFKEGFSHYLNYEIKEDELYEEIKTDKYNMLIINWEAKYISDLDIYKNINFNKKNANISLSIEEIYNIVERLYKYNFELLNKKDYILEIEKQKINIIKKTSKILGYDFHTYDFIKEEKMSQNEINKFIDFLFSNESYLIEFLYRLNNFRSSGKLEFTEYKFNIIKTIFDKAADYLLINKNAKIYRLLVIISQTFYIMKDGTKYFLQKELKKKKFFRQVDFWKNYIDDIINQELNKFEESIQTKKLYNDEKKKKIKIEQILFTQIVSFCTCFNGFELEKEIIDKILFPLFDKYNVSEETRQSIFPLLNVYKNTNS